MGTRRSPERLSTRPTLSPPPSLSPPRSYVGEWFDPKGEGSSGPVPLDQQRASAVHALWSAVAVYAVLFVLCSVIACVHRLRGSL